MKQANWKSILELVDKLVKLDDKKLLGKMDEQVETREEIKSIASKIKNIYIYGSVGVGKTYQMLKLKQIQGFKYIKWTNFIKTQHKAMTGGDLTTQDKWDIDYKRRDVLIIDDFATNKFSQWNMELLFELLDYRLDNNLSIIFTSNYNYDDLVKMWNTTINSDEQMKNRLASRFNLFTYINVQGNDRRKN